MELKKNRELKIISAVLVITILLVAGFICAVKTPKYYVVNIKYLVENGCRLDKVLLEIQSYGSTVFDSNMLIYYRKENDITDKIAKKLNCQSNNSNK